MRTIVAGSRKIQDPRIVTQAMAACGWTPTLVISGDAYGVDRLGERWAETQGIACVRMPADWATFGRSAGYRRNVAMAKDADALVAVWDGISKGTKHMIDIATVRGLRVFVYRTDQ